MTGRENWVQKMLNDQKDKLCNNSKVPNKTNQLQTQIMIERGNPLLEPIERATRCWNRPKDRVKWKKNVPFSGDRNTFFS